MTEPMTTTDPMELADKIDPRKPHVVCHTKGINEAADLILVERWDLIAASDMLRTLSPVSSEEIAGMVGMLRSIANGACVGTFSDERDLAGKAASLISRLHTRALLARGMAIEEAAKVCEVLKTESASNADGTAAYKDYWLGSELSAAVLVSRIRALSPTLDMDALVDRGAMALAKMTLTPELANFPERARARAVITALIGEP